MSTQTMKAVRQYAFGGPEVLRYEDAPRPIPGPGEILIRVHAVGLNPPDWYLRDGYSALPAEWQPVVEFPLTLGTDVSGVVTAVADDVTAFSVGDAVYSMVRFPTGMMGGSQGYAEYVTAPAAHVALKPVTLDYAEAAGAPMSLLTAWQFLVDLGHDEPNALQTDQHQPRPLKGKTVLVNGAAGGVGHFVVQVARLKGAKVIAVASARQATLLHQLGADEVIDYQSTRIADVVHDVDIVMDVIGGAAAEALIPAIKVGGALFLAFPLGFEGAAAAAERNITVSTTQVRSSGEQLKSLARLLDDGSLRTIIDSRFPLADAAKAHERAARGHIQGKIVLDVA